MQNLRNHSQLKDQENSPERTVKFFVSLSTRPRVQKGGSTNAKGIKKGINKNADPYDKKLKTTKRDQLRLENSLARIKAKLKAINSKVNNTKGKVSDMKDRIMKITQSEQ